MRRLLPRILVAFLAILVGVGTSLVVSFLSLPAPVGNSENPCFAAEQQPPKEEAPVEFPDEYALSPYSIESFIELNPRSHLSKLWKRLDLKPNESDLLFNDECFSCNAETFEYDLDGQPGDEAILKISNQLGEWFRYLVFKAADSQWILLGHIDAWGKYKDSRHVVLIGNGKPLLIIHGQGASGSGVALYYKTVYEVDPTGIRLLFSYPSEGVQSGIPDGPDRWFDGEVLKIENHQGTVRFTVAFKVHYSIRQDSSPMISKEQIGVFSQESNGTFKLDPTRSTITQHELDSIYNIDSMTEMDFLKYNRDELHELATQGTNVQKEWLETYLKTFTNSRAKRKLLSELR